MPLYKGYRGSQFGLKNSRTLVLIVQPFTLYSQHLWQPDSFQFRWASNNCCYIKDRWDYGLVQKANKCLEDLFTVYSWPPGVACPPCKILAKSQLNQQKSPNSENKLFSSSYCLASSISEWKVKIFADGIISLFLSLNLLL